MYLTLRLLLLNFNSNFGIQSSCKSLDLTLFQNLLNDGSTCTEYLLVDCSLYKDIRLKRLPIIHVIKPSGFVY